MLRSGYRAYADALKAHDIPLDPNLITLPGDFLSSAGVQPECACYWTSGRLRPQVDF